MLSIDNILTIAVPKGRIQYKLADYFNTYGITMKEESRKLDYFDSTNKIRFLFVKNSDVPVYVKHGVADIGVSGSDVLYESQLDFLHLGTFPFGTTRICIAGYEKDKSLLERAKHSDYFVKEIRVATKFIKFTRDYFLEKLIPVEIINLTGSVELAPILGLSDFIVDLVETGQTLKENNLSVLEQIGQTEVKLIANRSLYKLKFSQINKFSSLIRGRQINEEIYS